MIFDAFCRKDASSVDDFGHDGHFKLKLFRSFDPLCINYPFQNECN